MNYNICVQIGYKSKISVISITVNVIILFII